MKKKLLFLLLIASNRLLFSQNDIDKSYIDYFSNTREVPYLHLNKTSFLQGEEIWFKAYVQEQNSNKLHSTTTNLYVSIFNDKASLIKQKLIQITDGVGRGNFLLDSTYTDSNYFLKSIYKMDEKLQRRQCLLSKNKTYQTS